MALFTFYSILYNFFKTLSAQTEHFDGAPPFQLSVVLYDNRSRWVTLQFNKDESIVEFS